MSLTLLAFISDFHKKRFYPHLSSAELSAHEKLFQCDVKEKHFQHILNMLKEIGNEFPLMNGDMVRMLSLEGIDL